MDLNDLFYRLNAIEFSSIITKYESDLKGKILLDIGILPPIQNYKCLNNQCKGIMTPHKSEEHVFGLKFICLQCHANVSWSKGTWFQKMRLSYIKCLYLIFCWCNRISATQLKPMIDISSKSINDFYAFMRQICELSLASEGMASIGGTEVIVEIDETHLHTRKYSKGRLLAKEREQIWVFGGIERLTKRCFVCIVPNRSQEVLIDKIRRYIKPGSIIISDQWRAYTKISEYGYKHFSVNHSENFVSPEADFIHVQTIERLWQSLKSIVPKKTSCKNLSSYCAEFMFRQNKLSDKNVGLRFKIILEKIRDQFPSALNQNKEN